MAQSDILKACNTILNTLPAFPVAWQNGQTDQTTTHYQQSFLPVESTNISVGFEGAQELTGIYQVLIAIPKNAGVGDGVVGEADLLTKFKRGTAINFGSQVAEVDHTYIESGFPVDEWFIIPCSVYYRGFFSG